MDFNKLCMSCMSESLAADGVCSVCGFDEKCYTGSAHHLPLKTILAAKILIGTVIGEGGFGITYVGFDLNLQQKIAIKEYYPSGFATRENTSTGKVAPCYGQRGEMFIDGKNKFIDEARRLARFNYLPGIVSVRDFIQENDTAYIVMEFIDGVTLKQFLSDNGGQIPSEQLFRMMKPIVESLSVIHAEGIIHRDISPDNIMITFCGKMKLIDFGAARDYGNDANKSMSVLLKPGYAPIEQYSSKGRQGPWTDVYAFCATMYKAITGTTPEDSGDRAYDDNLKKPSELGVAIDPFKEAVLLKGMAFAVQDRYQSLVELVEELYRVTDETSQPSVGTQQPEIPEEPSAPQEQPPTPIKENFGAVLKKQRRWLVLAGVACLMLVIYVTTLPKEEQSFSDNIVAAMDDIEVHPPIESAAPSSSQLPQHPPESSSSQPPPVSSSSKPESASESEPEPEPEQPPEPEPEQPVTESLFVYDNMELLTLDDALMLNSVAEVFSYAHNKGIYILTLNDYNDVEGATDIYEAATFFYDNNNLGLGENREGVMLLLSVGTSEYQFIMHGPQSKEIFDSQTLQAVEGAVLEPLINGDWYGAFNMYIEMASGYMMGSM